MKTARKLTLIIFMVFGLFAQSTKTTKPQTKSIKTPEELANVMGALRETFDAQHSAYSGVVSAQQELGAEVLGHAVTKESLGAVVRQRAQMEKVGEMFLTAFINATNFLSGKPGKGISGKSWDGAKAMLDQVKVTSLLMQVKMALDEPCFREAWQTVFNESLPEGLLPPFGELLQKFQSATSPTDKAALRIAPAQRARDPGPPLVLGGSFVFKNET